MTGVQTCALPISLGSEKACRDAGKIGVEGKEYVVQDGDIMHFLFNV